MSSNIPDFVPKELLINMPWIGCNVVQETPDSKPTKLPINPHTGRLASVTDPKTWGTFQQCWLIRDRVTCLSTVLYPNCGYVCIDLDEPKDQAEYDRNLTIIKACNSYTEYSYSGKGFHIWIRAKIPSGRRRNNVEMYSESRHMVTTGNVFLNVPILDCQDIAMQLWNEMAPAKEVITSDKNEPQIYTDYQILEFASEAVNGQKFIDLFEGRWQEYYNDDPKKLSCNEADFALVNMLAFYTQNREQIVRLFHQSALGKRDKAKRQQYILYMLNRAFDMQPPDLDLSTLRQNLEAKLAANQQATAVTAESTPTHTIPLPVITPQTANTEVVFSPEPVKTCNSEQIIAVNEEIQTKPVKTAKKQAATVKHVYDPPPGLVGDIARFIYESAPRPVVEIALAGAIGLMSGVCGRSYNISGTGLNTYTFLLAKTGRGKESMRKGCNKLIGAVMPTVPEATSFMGPAKIASAQALVKYISKTSSSFLSIMGEFADTLKKMSNDSRNPIQQDVRVAMLDLYNQSGKGDVLGSLIYSKQEESTKTTNAPAFSILGESTPDKFYELLSKDMINEGLLPRCTIIEYSGERVPANKNHINVVPSQKLIDMFSSICAYSLQLNNNNQVVKVNISEEAQELFDSFDKYCDNKINTGNGICEELWNRAHIKALKLAGLLAVGCNYINPIVDVECAKWALNLITNDVQNLVNRFESGSVGVEPAQNEQITDIKKAFKKYVTSEWEAVKGYPGTSLTIWSLKLVPHSFITSFCRARSSFKNDRLGPIQAIKTCIASLIECDEIKELTIQDKRKNNLPLTNAKLYAISGMSV